MKRKVISILLSAALCVCLPGSVMAEETTGVEAQEFQTEETGDGDAQEFQTEETGDGDVQEFGTDKAGDENAQKGQNGELPEGVLPDGKGNFDRMGGKGQNGTGEKSEGMNGEFRGGNGDRGGMGGTQEDQVSHYSEAAEKFEQYEYADEETGAVIPYNLYLPESYETDTDKTYPIVIFIADAGANSNEVTDVLKEDGAAVWATDEEQAKHECIVLVPQYTQDLMNSIGALTEDTYQWSTGLTLVSNLIFHILDEYRVDESRVYGTGQSQGGMTAIALSDKYPDLYRAQLLVACQWNTEEMSVMKDDSLWIVVCEGDTKHSHGPSCLLTMRSTVIVLLRTVSFWKMFSAANGALRAWLPLTGGQEPNITKKSRLEMT